jgi:hypothetical protein
LFYRVIGYSQTFRGTHARGRVEYSQHWTSESKFLNLRSICSGVSSRRYGSSMIGESGQQQPGHWLTDGPIGRTLICCHTLRHTRALFDSSETHGTLHIYICMLCYLASLHEKKAVELLRCQQWPHLKKWCSDFFFRRDCWKGVEFVLCLQRLSRF